VTDKERAIRQRLKDDFVHYAPRCLRIRTKSGEVKSFFLNKAQAYLHHKAEEQRKKYGWVRIIGLKGRQQGFSTYVEGRYYWRVSHLQGVRAFILTHDAEATSNLFEMANRYHENCPSLVQPLTEASNAKELLFGKLDSGYKVGTAGNKAVGRSSTIQYFHGSEVAFWPNASEHAKGILQAVPREPGTEVFLESTANGLGNYYHQQWQLAESGDSDYLAVFIPWYWQDEYRAPVPEGFVLTAEESEYAEAYGLDNEQLAWRRLKIRDLTSDGVDGVAAFRQEYPATAQEAFQTSTVGSLLNQDAVLKARKAKGVKAFGPLIVGVDPASGEGDDGTAFAFRQGRVVHAVMRDKHINTMGTVGRVAGWLNKGVKIHGQIVRVRQVNIDVGGLGVGIVDRLRELGHEKRIRAVNFQSTAFNEERYANRRAEMWGEMAAWFEDGPVSIPDRDSLHSDLLGVRRKSDSNSRLLLEDKKSMKTRGLRSPDEGDAEALTHAEPVSMEEDDTSVGVEGVEIFDDVVGY